MRSLTEEEYKLLKQTAEHDSITMESMTKQDKRILKRLIALGYVAPLSDESEKQTNYTSEVLNEKSKDERYQRYKYQCYRNLILKSLLAFIFGLFLCALLKLY